MRRPFGLLEALFFLSLFVTAQLLNVEFQRAFVRTENTLIFMVVGFLGFFVYVWLGFRPDAKNRDRWRWLVMATTFMVIIGILWFRQVQLRQATTTAEGYNDGVVQTMEAANFLLAGVNPYQADYAETTFQYFHSMYSPNTDNVANTHFVYPPATFLLIAPATWLHRHVSTWFDVESMYIGYFLIFSGLLIWTQRTWDRRSLMTVLTIGNPVLWLFAMSGFNETLVALGLVATAWCALRGQWRLAGLLYGVALASKQTAWLTLPLMGAWVWFAWRQQVAIRTQLKTFMLWTIGASLVLYLPFFVWSPTDLWLDLVVYPSGSIPFSYPISGWSLLQYLRVWGVISSPWAVLPAWQFQALVAVPLYALAVVQIRRQPTAYQWLGLSTMVILGVTLMSRFGADNYYFGIGLLLLGLYALATIDDRRTDEIASTPKQ